ncbi:hypothetical protein AQ619_02785 [Caulobacter henricii]|uniref:Uncharacterized protein n=1 Tax=Caulobacter henricii TaxID=69395 RepID=A0A0N7JH45_9CAUL|nr:hypothetical protein AQ619_02785 [Caulobacter henricii]
MISVSTSGAQHLAEILQPHRAPSRGLTLKPLVELELWLRVSSRTTRSVAATRPPEAVLDETLSQSKLASMGFRARPDRRGGRSEPFSQREKEGPVPAKAGMGG